MDDKTTYDTSIGTSERSVKSATKVWAIVLAVVFLAGLVMLYAFLSSGTDTDGSLPGAGRPAAGGAAEP